MPMEPCLCLSNLTLLLATNSPIRTIDVITLHIFYLFLKLVLCSRERSCRAIPQNTFFVFLKLLYFLWILIKSHLVIGHDLNFIELVRPKIGSRVVCGPLTSEGLFKGILCRVPKVIAKAKQLIRD